MSDHFKRSGFKMAFFWNSGNDGQTFIGLRGFAEGDGAPWIHYRGPARSFKLTAPVNDLDELVNVSLKEMNNILR